MRVKIQNCAESETNMFFFGLCSKSVWSYFKNPSHWIIVFYALNVCVLCAFLITLNKTKNKSCWFLWNIECHEESFLN